MFKKMTVLAMAVGVVAAFALPTSASAAWKHHGIPIQQNVDIPFTGTAEFTTQNLGGIRCQVSSTATFFTGQTTGAIDTFKPHPTSDTVNCAGFGGLAFCQVHNLTPTGLSPHGTGWVIHTAQSPANTIAITYGEIHSQTTGGFCPIKSVTITAGTAIATPNQPNTVTSVQLSGEVKLHLETASGAQDTPEPTHIGGTLTIESPSSKHTYDV